jgi:hypothetical protein
MYRSRKEYTNLADLLVQVREDIADVHARKSSEELMKDVMYTLLLKLAADIQLAIWRERRKDRCG